MFMVSDKSIQTRGIQNLDSIIFIVDSDVVLLLITLKMRGSVLSIEINAKKVKKPKNP